MLYPDSSVQTFAHPHDQPISSSLSIKHLLGSPPIIDDLRVNKVHGGHIGLHIKPGVKLCQMSIINKGIMNTSPHQVSWVIFHDDCVCIWMVDDDRLGASNKASVIKDEHKGVIVGIGESFTQDVFRLWLELPSKVFSLPLGPANIYINLQINPLNFQCFLG